MSVLHTICSKQSLASVLCRTRKRLIHTRINAGQGPLPSLPLRWNHCRNWQRYRTFDSATGYILLRTWGHAMYESVASPAAYNALVLIATFFEGLSHKICPIAPSYCSLEGGSMQKLNRIQHRLRGVTCRTWWHQLNQAAPSSKQFIMESSTGILQQITLPCHQGVGTLEKLQQREH